MSKNQLEIIRSTGNVFEDLGFKDAKQRLAKAEIVSRINDIIDERKLNQIDAGILLKINQPKVSALMQGRLEGFSLERLLVFLTRLDQQVKIVVQDKPKSKEHHGKLMVAFA